MDGDVINRAICTFAPVSSSELLDLNEKETATLCSCWKVEAPRRKYGAEQHTSSDKNTQLKHQFVFKHFRLWGKHVQYYRRFYTTRKSKSAPISSVYKTPIRPVRAVTLFFEPQHETLRTKENSPATLPDINRVKYIKTDGKNSKKIAVNKNMKATEQQASESTMRKETKHRQKGAISSRTTAEKTVLPSNSETIFPSESNDVLETSDAKRAHNKYLFSKHKCNRHRLQSVRQSLTPAAK